MKNLVICAVLCLFVCVGCGSILQSLADFAADPNASGAVERGVEGAAGVAGFFGPIGGLIAGGIGTGLMIWRKVKPTLAAAKTEAQQYHAAGAAVVTAIEAYKVENPSQWLSLGAMIDNQLTEQGIDKLVIENVIRGLRGLPAKAVVG